MVEVWPQYSLCTICNIQMGDPHNSSCTIMLGAEVLRCWNRIWDFSPESFCTVSNGATYLANIGKSKIAAAALMHSFALGQAFPEILLYENKYDFGFLSNEFQSCLKWHNLNTWCHAFIFTHFVKTAFGIFSYASSSTPHPYERVSKWVIVSRALY